PRGYPEARISPSSKETKRWLERQRTRLSFPLAKSRAQHSRGNSHLRGSRTCLLFGCLFLHARANGRHDANRLAGCLGHVAGGLLAHAAVLGAGEEVRSAAAG